MPQIQEQQLTQEQRQLQTITQQQLLQAQLTELPIAQLVERVTAEMDDNPALEVATGDDPVTDWTDDAEPASEAASADDYEREERQSALDEALQSIGRDDEELPVYHGGNATGEEREEMVYGQSVSFYDLLNEQVGEVELTDRQRDIVEYLIGSLDDDGLLRKSTSQLSDELAIYQGIDATTTEIEQALHTLQQFEPPGIGARSLQECLLLQIARKNSNERGARKELYAQMRQVVEHHFDEFTKKHWDKISQQLQLSDVQAATLFDELRRLNPKPGASMGETVGRSLHQITPDFIVDTQDDGTVTFQLNSGDLPELSISQSFVDTLKEYQTNRDNMSRQMKEALLYTKKKVAAAQGFIEAIRTRRHTLTVTMQAIIQWQHRFFEDGDEASLRPMILKDIAQRTGLDVSTISRVSNSKYAQTRWGTFPLRHFFSDAYVTAGGEELSTRQIKAALRDIIDAEDKRRPMSDDALTAELKRKGLPIARRTVAKYREQMGIPIARLRRNS